MPLNSTPCTVTREDVDRKRAALEASSIADFGLWGGLVPGSVEHMADDGRARGRGIQGVHVRLRACRNFRARTRGRCATACAKRRGWICRLPCMPRARRSRARWRRRCTGSTARRLSAIAACRGRDRRHRARDRHRRRNRCASFISSMSVPAAAWRRREGARAGRRRVGRDLPALSVLHRRRSRAARRRREMRAAAARC